MVLERAQDDLRAADSFIGQVRFLIRRSGQSAFEYASMREDYMPTSSGKNFMNLTLHREIIYASLQGNHQTLRCSTLTLRRLVLDTCCYIYIMHKLYICRTVPL